MQPAVAVVDSSCVLGQCAVSETVVEMIMALCCNASAHYSSSIRSPLPRVLIGTG